MIRLRLPSPKDLARLAALLVLLTPIACSDDSPTDPGDGGGGGPTASNIAFDRLGVAVPLGGSQTVEVTPLNGALDPITVESSDESVATVSSPRRAEGESSVIIAAGSAGEATITVSTEAGDSRQFPVTVYDPTVLDAGEFLIKFVTDFDYTWNDSGTGAALSVGLFTPVPPEGFHRLGLIEFPSYGTDIDGQAWAMVVKDKGLDPSRPAIVEAESYEPIISARGATFWRPVPPTDLPDEYVALGVVAGSSALSEPAVTAVCVRKDLTGFGSSQFIWNDRDSGSSLPIMSVWRTNTRPYDPQVKPYPDLEKEYVSAGVCVVMPNRSDPQLDSTYRDVGRILKITPQVLIDSNYSDWVPSLYSSRGETQKDTQPLRSVLMLVPFTAFNDPGVPSLSWQVENTPFYILERRTYWNEEYLGAIGGTRTWTTGVEETALNESWQETMEVSFDAGMAIKTALSGRPSITGVVTKTMGFSSSESVSQFSEDMTSVPVPSPPDGGRVALWRKRNQFVVSRHGETGVEQFLTPWSFDENVFHFDSFPD